MQISTDNSDADAPLAKPSQAVAYWVTGMLPAIALASDGLVSARRVSFDNSSFFPCFFFI
jgi:hypothetical protein